MLKKKCIWCRSIMLFLMTVLILSGSLFSVSTSAASGKVSIPHPQEYFGAVSDSSVTSSAAGSWTNFYFENYSTLPETIIDDYIETLEDRGINLAHEAWNTSGGKRYELHLKDDSAVSIYWMKNKKQIRVQVFHDVVLVRSSQVNTKRGMATISSLIERYFGTCEESYSKSMHMTFFTFKMKSYPNAKISKFTDAMEDIGISDVKVTQYEDGSRIVFYKWKNETCVKLCWTPEDSIFDARVYWEYIDNCGLFDNADIPVKTVDPTTPEPTESDNDEYEPVPVLRNCSSCFGSGKCNWCNGKGYKKRAIIGQPGEYSTQTCSGCSGLKRCSSCRGTGHQ